MPFYRSKIHSPLEANPNKYRTDVLSPLEASPNKYRSREASALVAEWTPPTASCWGWFKHDEGSGTTIIDYSPVAANGILFNGSQPGGIPTAAQRNYFWNTNIGYGTGASSYNSCVSRRIGPSRSSAYVSLVAFIKPINTVAMNPTFLSVAVQLGEATAQNLLQVGWHYLTPFEWAMNYSAGNKFSAQNVTFNIWYCVYAYSQASANNNGLYIRKSGDSDWTQALVNQGNAATAGVQSGIYSFGLFNNPLGMGGGDILYYADSTAPTGIITLAQATDIFNNLKSRYGM